MNHSRKEFLYKAGALGGLLFLHPKSYSFLQNNLPNVLIIGDSISIGYTPIVKEILGGKATVSRPDENCQGTTKGVAKIDEWLGTTRWDVIHFNFGLHDLKHVHPVTGENSSNPADPLQADLKTYRKNLEFIINRMKASGAKLILATTTPVPENTRPLRDPGMEVKYNQVAVKLAKKHKITVNDLYSFALPVLSEIQRPENVHFTDEGSRRLGERVAEAVLEVLGRGLSH